MYIEIYMTCIGLPLTNMLAYLKEAQKALHEKKTLPGVSSILVM